MVFHEFLLRETLGDPPDLAEIAARFPDLAPAIAAQIEVHRAVDDQAEVLADWPRIAEYEIVAELGRGGMGIVYKARQGRLQRTVAIKVLRDGALSSELLARFRVEAVLLARLQHPNFVQVFEVGEAQRRGAAPAPFLSLEYVPGGTLADRLQGGPMPTLAAATVVEALARALAVAHAAGVVHRDLKPSNVLMAGDVPKISDFGLAKQVGAASQTFATVPGEILGTPSYMSPEQARGGSATVGPAADLYALGAVLYECLTGRPPFQGASPIETLQLVLATDPVPVCRLRPEAPRDLETIALKCLEKEPARRYASANDVADELRRHLEGRPISARPVSRAEHAWRWAKRRPLVAGLLLALVAAVISGTSGIAWQWRAATDAAADAELRRKEAVAATNEAVRESKEKEAQRVLAEKARSDAIRESKEKEVQRERAVEQAALAKAVRDYLQYDLLQFASPDSQYREERAGRLKMNPDLKVRDLVVRAARTIEGKFPGQPLVEAEIRCTLGWTLQEFGRSDLAVAQYERAHELRRKEQGPAHRDTIQALSGLASSHAGSGNYKRAMQLRKEALKLCQQSFGPDDIDTLHCMHALANSYADFGHLEDALSLRKDVLRLRTVHLGPGHPDTIWSMQSVASSFSALGRHSEAQGAYQLLHAARRLQLGPNHPDTLVCEVGLANSLLEPGRNDEVIRAYEDNVAVCRAKLGVNHPTTLVSMTELANGYYAKGDYRQALKINQELVKRSREILGNEHPVTINRLNNLGNAHQALGDHTKALELHEESLKRARAALGSRHVDTLNILNNLGNTYFARKQYQKAAALLEEALTGYIEQLGPDDPHAIFCQGNLANTFLNHGRVQEALERYQLALKHGRARIGADHPALLRNLSNMGACYFRLCQYDAAVKAREEAFRGMKTKFGDDHPETLESMCGLAWSLMKSKRDLESVAVIDEFLRLAKGRLLDQVVFHEMLDLRLRHFENAMNPRGCRETAEMGEKLDLADPKSVYLTACYRAVASGRFAATGADDEAKTEAARAMTNLRRAVKAGFRDLALLEWDFDLDPLRNRPDFQELVRSVAAP